MCPELTWRFVGSYALEVTIKAICYFLLLRAVQYVIRLHHTYLNNLAHGRKKINQK